MPESLLQSPRRHYGCCSGTRAPRPPVQPRHKVHSVLIALPLLSGEGSETLPRITVGRILTDWGIDPIPFVGTVWVAGLYLVGGATLRRRGDRWPVGRTLAFVGLGM